MKSLQVSEDILPVGVLKTQLAQVLRKLREQQRPIVVTQHGKPAAVLITPEIFDRLCEHERFLEAVREGLDDSETGRVVEDEVLTAELDAALRSPAQP